jgi:hypothetical protein
VSSGLTLGLLALAGLALLGWQVLRDRPRLGDGVGRLAPALEPLGLLPLPGEVSAEYCVQRYAGTVRGRPASLRILERPGRTRLLVWVDLEAPAQLADGLVALPQRLGEVHVRRVRGGYRLVLRAPNRQGWMADVELGLRAVDNDGRTSIHARRLEGERLRVGFDCSVAELAETTELAEELVAALLASAVRAWRRAAEERGFELGPWSGGFRPIQGRRGDCEVLAQAEEGRTVVRVRFPGGLLEGVSSVRHKDLGQGMPTGNAVMDMLVSVQGRAAIWHDEELVAALLEVVHAWPGSELVPGQVVLRADRHLGAEVGPALDASLRLAELCAR